MPGFHDSTFNGLSRRRGTPREVIERLRAEVAKAAPATERPIDYSNRVSSDRQQVRPRNSPGFLRKQLRNLPHFARQAGIKAN